MTGSMAERQYPTFPLSFTDIFLSILHALGHKLHILMMYSLSAGSLPVIFFIVAQEAKDFLFLMEE